MPTPRLDAGSHRARQPSDLLPTTAAPAAAPANSLALTLAAPPLLYRGPWQVSSGSPLALPPPPLQPPLPPLPLLLTVPVLTRQDASASTEADVLRHLDQMLQILGPDWGLSLQSGQSWALDVERGLLICPTARLLRAAPEARLGLLCRQVARLRHSPPTPVAVRDRPILNFLWQLMETHRSLQLFQSEYAGAGRLVRAARPYLLDGQDEERLTVQFARSWLAQLDQEAPAPSAAPAVQEALAALAVDLAQITAPPPRLWRRAKPLSQEENDELSLVATRRLVANVMPRFMRLVVEDLGIPQPQEMDAAATLAYVEGTMSGGIGGLNFVLSRVADQLSAHLPEPSDDEVAAALPRSAPARQTRRLAGRAIERLHLDSVSLRACAPRYARLCGEHADAIRSLQALLRRVLPTPGRAGFVANQRRGQLDMPRYIQAHLRASAGQGGHARVFKRRLQPAPVGRVGFVLCADRSDSMGGQRVTHLRAGLTVLLAATSGLGMPVGVVAFDSTACVLKEPDEILDTAACDALLAHMQPRGGTNDVDALRAAVALAQPSDVRRTHILFITDGGGSSDLAAEIAALRQGPRSIEVVGIGIGPGCNLVPGTFPAQNLLVPDTSLLPDALGKLMLQIQNRAHAR